MKGMVKMRIEEQSILDATPSRSINICGCNKRCQAAVINKPDENPSIGDNAKLCQYSQEDWLIKRNYQQWKKGPSSD